MHTFNLNTWEAKAGGLCKFEASLDYRVSSRTARAIQKNSVLKKTKNKKQKKKKKGRSQAWSHKILQRQKDKRRLTAHSPLQRINYRT